MIEALKKLFEKFGNTAIAATAAALISSGIGTFVLLFVVWKLFLDPAV